MNTGIFRFALATNISPGKGVGGFNLNSGKYCLILNPSVQNTPLPPLYTCYKFNLPPPCDSFLCHQVSFTEKPLPFANSYAHNILQMIKNYKRALLTEDFTTDS